MNIKHIDRMIKALDDFSTSHMDIVDLWNSGIDLNETESIKDYPFNLSFDDICIHEWVYNTIRELEKMKK